MQILLAWAGFRVGQASLVSQRTVSLVTVNFSSVLSYWKDSCQMLSVFWHVILNDAQWPHGLMCPGVKQGCPDQPLTPGSCIRWRSRRSSIDKGHRRGHPLSRFTSIQLRHQQLNRWLLFTGTLIVLIGCSSARRISSPLSAAQWQGCFSHLSWQSFRCGLSCKSLQHCLVTKRSVL